MKGEGRGKSWDEGLGGGVESCERHHTKFETILWISTDEHLRVELSRIPLTSIRTKNTSTLKRSVGTFFWNTPG